MDLIINFLAIFCSRWTYYELCTTKTWRKYLRLRPMDTTHCPPWKGHIVFVGLNILSSLNRTHCLRWKEHIVFFGKNTLSSLARTHCLLWPEHIVFVGKNTLSSLEGTQLPLSGTLPDSSGVCYSLWRKYNSGASIRRLTCINTCACKQAWRKDPRILKPLYKSVF